jgi:hypothetical protein
MNGRLGRFSKRTTNKNTFENENSMNIYFSIKLSIDYLQISIKKGHL